MIFICCHNQRILLIRSVVEARSVLDNEMCNPLAQPPL
jgi:hypothetical protein